MGISNTFNNRPYCVGLRLHLVRYLNNTGHHVDCPAEVSFILVIVEIILGVI